MRLRSIIGAKYAHLLTPCKNMGGLVEIYMGIFFMQHLGSKRRYTFHLAAIGRLVTLRTGD